MKSAEYQMRSFAPENYEWVTMPRRKKPGKPYNVHYFQQKDTWQPHSAIEVHIDYFDPNYWRIKFFGEEIAVVKDQPTTQLRKTAFDMFTQWREAVNKSNLRFLSSYYHDSVRLIVARKHAFHFFIYFESLLNHEAQNNWEHKVKSEAGFNMRERVDKAKALLSDIYDLFKRADNDWGEMEGVPEETVIMEWKHLVNEKKEVEP